MHDGKLARSFNRTLTADIGLDPAHYVTCKVISLSLTFMNFKVCTGYKCLGRLTFFFEFWRTYVRIKFLMFMVFQYTVLCFNPTGLYCKIASYFHAVYLKDKK